MTAYLNYNGSIYNADRLIISADNRGFRYGDGIFETMRLIDGRIQLAAYHYDRLFEGIRLLEFEKPDHFTREYFTGQVFELCRKNNLRQAKVRLMIFRGNGGLYDLESYPHFIIQTEELQPAFHSLNVNGLSIGIYTHARIPVDRFANLKSNNFLAYSMAALHTKRHNLDDSLLLNANGNICEATIANVFIIKDQQVITPSLQEGCVAGVMRRYLLENFHTIHLAVREGPLGIQDIENADEIFLSNAVSGIRWVRQCRDTKYLQTLTAQIYHALLKDLLLHPTFNE